ncbi:hypothetical protein M3231_10510 [Neobacillus mesonae]|nr:hypothetical protein [Neobacillus mesonae]
MQHNPTPRKFLLRPLAVLVISLCILLIVIFAAIFIANKEYYPNLPFEGMSKKEAVNLLNQNPGTLQVLSESGDTVWMAMKGNLSEGKEQIMSLMEARGWNYRTQEGSGYFFTKEDLTSTDTVPQRADKIVTSRVWTRDIILFRTELQ